MSTPSRASCYPSLHCCSWVDFPQCHDDGLPEETVVSLEGCHQSRYRCFGIRTNAVKSLGSSTAASFILERMHESRYDLVGLARNFPQSLSRTNADRSVLVAQRLRQNGACFPGLRVDAGQSQAASLRSSWPPSCCCNTLASILTATFGRGANFAKSPDCFSADAIIPFLCEPTHQLRND